jgi:hypothetical protein
MTKLDVIPSPEDTRRMFVADGFPSCPRKSTTFLASLQSKGPGALAKSQVKLAMSHFEAHDHLLRQTD